MNALLNSFVLAELRRAWSESESDDVKRRHKEGGYVLLIDDGSYSVHRWPRGETARILPSPLDPQNCYNGSAVAFTFHTHPNPVQDERGREWEQGPGSADRRWHQRRRLSGVVIARDLMYQTGTDGSVLVLGQTREVLGI